MYHNYDIRWILNWRFVAPLIYSIISLFLFQLLSLIIDKYYNYLTIKRYVLYCDIEKQKAIKYREVINARTENKHIVDLENEISTLKDIIETQKIEYSTLVKNNLINVRNNKFDNDSFDNEIAIIVLNNLTHKPSPNNGSFNLVKYIYDFINSNNSFREIDLYNIIYEAVKIYFFENEKYLIDHNEFQISTILTQNVKNLINYLIIHELISKNEILSASTDEVYYS